MTAPRPPRVPPRGFTLIEVMMVVAIVGVLSSVGLPTYQRAMLRAKAAERAALMSAIAVGMTDLVQSQQAVPGGVLVGAPNPPGPLSTTRRPLQQALPGWSMLPIVMQGSAYYQYWFAAVDGGGTGITTFDLFGTGDLDADGVVDSKWMHYEATGYALLLVSQNPPQGQENATTF